MTTHLYSSRQPIPSTRHMVSYSTTIHTKLTCPNVFNGMYQDSNKMTFDHDDQDILLRKIPDIQCTVETGPLLGVKCSTMRIYVFIQLESVV